MIVAAGVIIGLAPCSLARRQRSASSPYMKNLGSNPLRRSHHEREISRKQPLTMSTSRTASRIHPPYASGLNSGDRGKSELSPVAAHMRLHNVCLRQHEAGFRV